MTRKEDDRVFFERENPQQCDLCGAIAELRPYGPNGEKICIGCGNKNPEATLRMIRKFLLDSSSAPTTIYDLF